MRTFRVRRPSPALVVSIIALVVALGGTSYAAFSVPRNSVGTRQLKNNAVTTGKIKNGAVATSKIKSGAVTGQNIAKKTITAREINLRALGTVPSANTANTANTATIAGTAANANHATDASNLGGSPASAYQQKIMWARVAPDGTLTASSNSGITSGLLATGDYEVIFNRSVAGCAFEATIGSSLLSNDSFNDSGAGMIYTEPRQDNPNGVFVATLAPTNIINKTTNAFANPADNAFHLIVVC